MDSLKGYKNYDHLLQKPLARRGWETHIVSWRDKTIDWNRFDAVLIRSSWDYQADPDLFIEVLQDIQHSCARLENSLPLVLWNINKTYLQDLLSAGFEIVPTWWPQKLDIQNLSRLFESLNRNEMVIKPLVSANADNTFRLTPETLQQRQQELIACFSSRPFMVQPFMQSIIEEGEFSLFFFGGEYSHAILKKPASGDFRVQEEHGGKLLTVIPQKQLLEFAIQVNRYLRPAPLYSRLDFVRNGSRFAIMEIELIEPSLYFNMDEGSAERFAQAFERCMNA